jgi:hypothetical protein
VVVVVAVLVVVVVVVVVVVGLKSQNLTPLAYLQIFTCQQNFIYDV